MSITVAIIEDDPVVSRYLSTLISDSPLCELVGVASNKAQAQAIIKMNAADIYLVDLGLPDVSGIELMRQIGQECLDAKIMVLTSLGDMRHVMQSIEAGASGYLLKDDEPGELIGKLVSLHNGNSPVSAGVAKLLIKKLAQTDDVKTKGPDPAAIELFRLTPREVQILIELRSPSGVKTIADKLCISYFTANQHIRHLYRKLGVSSRSAALNKATDHGLL